MLKRVETGGAYLATEPRHELGSRARKEISERTIAPHPSGDAKERLVPGDATKLYDRRCWRGRLRNLHIILVHSRYSNTKELVKSLVVDENALLGAFRTQLEKRGAKYRGH